MMRKTILFIFFAEILSFCGYLLPEFNQIAFLVIVAVTLALSVYRLEYGIWMVLAELFIGSKGYLFYFTAGGTVISIRIALWLIVMSVWLAGVFWEFAKTRRMRLAGNSTPARHTLLPYFLPLSAAAGWALLNGFLRGNFTADIFFDFNGWLYFTLALPVYGVIFAGDAAAVLSRLWRIFSAAMAWLAFKTLFLLFMFTHYLAWMAPEIYRWVRISGVGEITDMQNGFYRIFFQSLIFALAGSFAFLFLFLRRWQTIAPGKKRGDSRLWAFFAMLCILAAVILTGFARSNWVGFLAGTTAVFCYQWAANRGSARWKMSLRAASVILLSFFFGAGIMAAVSKFPYPPAIGGFSTADLLTERATLLTGEAGAASRWSLLPPLMAEIRTSPILGHGFGATVTYGTSDPRVLAGAPDGNYTTYAFEWGWLDIWVKLGIFGLIFYLFLLAMIFKSGLAATRGVAAKGVSSGGARPFSADIMPGMLAGLFAVTVVNFFSPYLNHPLGFGYVILCAAAADSLKNTIARNRGCPLA